MNLFETKQGERIKALEREIYLLKLAEEGGNTWCPWCGAVRTTSREKPRTVDEPGCRDMRIVELEKALLKIYDSPSNTDTIIAIAYDALNGNV